MAGQRRIAYRLLRIAADLDSARTSLVDAGRRMVADYAVVGRYVVAVIRSMSNGHIRNIAKDTYENRAAAVA